MIEGTSKASPFLVTHESLVCVLLIPEMGVSHYYLAQNMKYYVILLQAPTFERNAHSR